MIVPWNRPRLSVFKHVPPSHHWHLSLLRLTLTVVTFNVDTQITEEKILVLLTSFETFKSVWSKRLSPCFKVIRHEGVLREWKLSPWHPSSRYWIGMCGLSVLAIEVMLVTSDCNPVGWPAWPAWRREISCDSRNRILISPIASHFA